MLQVARLAPTFLGESRDLVSGFLRRSLNPDGGFKDRAGDSDLYYTVFGLEGLLALGEQIPSETSSYLRAFGDGQSLDFVHLACLARCWGSASGLDQAISRSLRGRLQSFRSDDGGFAAVEHASMGSAYACFLAMAAFEELGADVPDGEAMLRCLDSIRSADGGYSNHPGASEGSTPATAAAVMVTRHLGGDLDASVSRWLRERCHSEGGFFAAPRAPMPDLLSTATALHALAALHADLDPLRESCLDFVDTLWTNRGAFHGNWADDALDCEYTYYGLLALGHLSL